MMKLKRIEFACTAGEREFSVATDCSVRTDHLSLDIVQDENTLRVDLRTDRDIVIRHVRAVYECSYSASEAIFLNGYQSWTDSIEHTIRDKMHGLNRIPKSLIEKYAFTQYGDYTFVDYPDKPGLLHGFSLEESLVTREFEPDAPNYTPRISGLMTVADGNYEYSMSILKSADGDPSACNRYTFNYEKPLAGEGRFIHTYMGDGNPLPSFTGEPERVEISGDIDSFTNAVWEALNEDNKVSLFVRYIDIATGATETRIVNKNK